MLECPRGGKVAAQDSAVRRATSEVVAFSDGNATWAPDALQAARREPWRSRGRLRLRPAATQDCGRHEPRRASYWRYEMKLPRRRVASSARSRAATAPSTPLNRPDYVEVDPRWGHDLSFPYRMVQAGRRAVYEPAGARLREADAVQRDASIDARCGCSSTAGRSRCAARCSGGCRPATSSRSISHRLLRYGSGILHRRPARPPASRSSATAGHTGSCSPGQVALIAAAAAGVPIARYYALVTLGDRRRTLELPPPRRARDVGGRGGDPMNRALDVVGRRRRARAREPDRLPPPRSRSSSKDGGPVLFRQTRVGKDGVDFELPRSCGRWSSAPSSKGAGYAVDAGDSRITRVGRILRTTSVDELPQLWNVVRGEMSLIGPRPTLRYQVDDYTDAAAEAARRHGPGSPGGPRSTGARRCPGPSGSSWMCGTWSIARRSSTRRSCCVRLWRSSAVRTGVPRAAGAAELAQAPGARRPAASQPLTTLTPRGGTTAGSRMRSVSHSSSSASSPAAVYARLVRGSVWSAVGGSVSRRLGRARAHGRRRSAPFRSSPGASSRTSATPARLDPWHRAALRRLGLRRPSRDLRQRGAPHPARATRTTWRASTTIDRTAQRAFREWALGYLLPREGGDRPGRRRTGS